MLAIVSDLHLQHVSHDALRRREGDQVVEIGVHRNVSAHAMQRFLWMTLVAARRRHTRTIHLILAGDIFELHRTPRWLYGNNSVRPYDAATGRPDDPPEKNALLGRVLEILEAIQRDNRELLAVLQRFVGEGKVRFDNRTWTLAWSGAKQVRLHYIPGNHDRLANAWKAARRGVRSLLGLGPSDQPFPHLLDDSAFDESYGVRVRHGQEYDPANFSPADPKEALSASAQEYLAPALGDYVTVEFATRLTTAMRALFARELRTPGPEGQSFRDLYLSLTDFDDVRPPSLVVEYLTHGFGGTERRTFEVLRPLLRDAVDHALESSFFREHARRLGYWNTALATALGEGIKQMGATGLAALARGILERARDGGTPPARHARHEEGIGSTVRTIVAGHTHWPEQVPLPGGPEVFYVNSGTWRTTLPMGEDAFGRLRAYTVVFCMSQAEQQHGDGRRMETWTGHLLQERYGPYEETIEPAPSRPAIEIRQQIRFTRLRVDEVDERRAELSVQFGVDGEGLALRRGGVRAGEVIDLSMLAPVPLDAALDGEVWFTGIEEDTPALLDLDDPLPWALARLPRRRRLPHTPFRHGPGTLLAAGRGPFRLWLDYRLEARGPEA